MVVGRAPSPAHHWPARFAIPDSLLALAMLIAMAAPPAAPLPGAPAAPRLGAPQAPAPAAAGHVAGQVLVKARAGQQSALAARLAQVLPGATRRAAFPHRAASRADAVGLSRILVIDVAPGAESAAAAALAGEPSVEWCELNSRAGGITGQTIPNDPSFLNQWALSQWNDVDMDVPEAWFLRGTTQAANILVADIDTGYDTFSTSADWQGVIWTNPAEVQNGLDDDGNGLVDDVHGYDFAYNDSVPDATHPHGVATGGVIAARTGNGAQVAGIASGVTLLPLKVFDDNGFFPAGGPFAGTLSAATGIVYATDHGALLLNNSWTNGIVPDALLNDALQYAVDNGSHPIFAAGNNGTNQDWPAQNPNVIAVAAIDRNGKRSVWGGQSSCYGPWVDICAAGTDVTTTTLGGGVDNFFSGTSAACPQVTGVAALLLSANDALTTPDLRTLLMQGAVSVDAINPAFAGQLGAGQVNAFNSAALLAPWTDLGAALPGNFHPVLNAWGLTSPGAHITLSASHAAPTAPALLVAGFSALNAPFKGGVLVPAADIVLRLTTSPTGTLTLQSVIPVSLPSGPLLRAQLLVADAGAPKGIALSNAVLLTVP